MTKKFRIKLWEWTGGESEFDIELVHIHFDADTDDFEEDAINDFLIENLGHYEFSYTYEKINDNE